MSRAKVFISILTVLILIVLSGASVWAAPGGQQGDQISGVVEGIEIATEVDEETGDTITTVLVTLLVTLEDGSSETQTVRLSLETATGLGLVQTDENGDPVLDEDGNPIPNGDKIGETVDIDSDNVITPPIRGDVQEIVIEVDEDGTVTVLVTLIDESGQIQTVRLSLETAIALGLVEVDENGDPVLDEDGHPIPNEDMINQPVEIDPGDVIDGEEEEEGEEAQHPVASVLADFFAVALGLDYDMIMGYHEDGMGFGVIAKACWMSFALEGDAELLGDILEAKKSHDFSSIELPDGETPKNWGQFKKAVLGSKKVQKNLGEIMSGRAKVEQDETGDENELGATSTQGNVKGKKDKAGGKPEIPPGQVKKSGKPDTPPGKGKNKDKGKGGGKKK
ncbi:MAG: hypothetical protein E3J21_14760 [Anaerolineales bacterium]|nr:MAG: hypothetical protein E3J21_14760 [Anaerolineales bacterium]